MLQWYCSFFSPVYPCFYSFCNCYCLEFNNAIRIKMWHTYQQQYEHQESTINSDGTPPNYPDTFLNPTIILLMINLLLLLIPFICLLIIFCPFHFLFRKKYKKVSKTKNDTNLPTTWRSSRKTINFDEIPPLYYYLFSSSSFIWLLILSPLFLIFSPLDPCFSSFCSYMLINSLIWQKNNKHTKAIFVRTNNSKNSNTFFIK